MIVKVVGKKLIHANVHILANRLAYNNYKPTFSPRRLIFLDFDPHLSHQSRVPGTDSPSKIIWTQKDNAENIISRSFSPLRCEGPNCKRSFTCWIQYRFQNRTRSGYENSSTVRKNLSCWTYEDCAFCRNKGKLNKRFHKSLQPRRSTFSQRNDPTCFIFRFQLIKKNLFQDDPRPRFDCRCWLFFRYADATD